MLVVVEKALSLDGARLQDYYCCPDDDRHLEHHQHQLDLEIETDAADASDTWIAIVPSVPG